MNGTRHALVVGAGGALGQAVVRVLGAEGVVVSAAGRSLAEGVTVRGFETIDVRTADWEGVLARAGDAPPPVDLVVYVAGTAVFGEVLETPEDEARELFELNLWAMSRAARAAASLWQSRGLRGSFVAVLSVAGRRAVPGEGYYGASKAAASRLLETLDLESRGTGCRFLGVFPGRTKTPFRDTARWFGKRAAEPPYAASPEEVARKTVDVLLGRRLGRVFGLREQIVDLADRISPALYDWVLARRRSRGKGD